MQKSLVFQSYLEESEQKVSYPHHLEMVKLAKGLGAEGLS